ncbi:MAG: precorrin-6A reductase [Clostridiales bacterium]|nr:precorrin-6A reductase [Clostridiales bacterium]
MKAIVFSGTSEGREISEYLNGKKILTEVFVATDYGRDTMSNLEYVIINAGRLDEEEIKSAVLEADFVIDATHPFAEIVTKYIFSACAEFGIEYIRLLREKTYSGVRGIIYVNSIEEAVNILKDTKGNIFVSTGSKEILKYRYIDGYEKRIVARVLPVEEAKEKCGELELENVIYKKGPFSYSENLMEFKKYDIKWLVTKDSGKNGGAAEKIEAAESVGAKIIVIKRPFEKHGMSMKEVKKIIDGKVKENNKNMRFPLFIDISGKMVVIVGGGKVSARRTDTLLKFGAKIKVISPHFFCRRNDKNVMYIRKKFEPSDLDGAFMVIGATDDREINHFIYTLCKGRNIFYSITDCREECNFYFPAVCMNGELSIGVVSRGDKHGLVRETADKIRRLIVDA